ncbi:hypothetical protein M3Y99_00390700 [Aphelenchoides fujianensis]|nr:hypothetical protein M3Y99_00390700 [Aphelenchoides fujianensis]
MSAAFEKRLKKAIATLENTAVVEATSPRKQKESCTEACLTIRKLLVDEEYWPKSYTSRSITCLFDCLGKDDSSLRLLADQCLNACFRKFILRSHPSRCLAALLNEISRKGSARGFSVAIGMLLPALEKSRSNGLGSVYAMHFMHALREALRRPEQIVHSAIELWAEKIIAFFRHDFDKTHLNYANNLVHQCVENLSLSGQVNRASSAVLAAVARHVPGMFPIVNGRLLSLLASADEGAQKSQVVGILNTYRRVWSFALEELDLHITITKILCCLRANSSEIQSAALELLDSIVQSTPLSVLTFKPFQFTKNTVGLADLDESVVSRFNSCTSLFESATSSRAGDSEPLEMESLEDEYETAANSGDDAESLNESNSFMAAVDPLLQSQLSGEDLLDGTSPESNLAEDSFASPVEGPLCECLPTSFGSPSDDFCFFLSTWLVGKFLLTGQPGEIRSNAEVRTSLKILALKNLASIAAIYEPLADVVVCSKNYKQPITEIYQYFTYDDDVLCMSVYSLFAAMERTAFRSGRKLSAHQLHVGFVV